MHKDHFSVLQAEPQTKYKRFSGKYYFSHHWQAALASFRALSQAPFATVLTLSVIAIALALPFGLMVLLNNVQQLTPHFSENKQISLYLNKSLTPSLAQSFYNQLLGHHDIARARLITPEQGLAEFKEYSGFSEVLAELEVNPLPFVIELQPSGDINSGLAMQQLVLALKQHPEVDSVKLDLIWIQRFQSFVSLATRLVYGFGLLLAVGVVLIVGNTIRLNTQNRREEIEVIKLIGGTDAFIRRPFLYSGFYYGTIAAIFAMLLIEIFLSWLTPPIEELTRLYHNHFYLQGLDNYYTLLLLFSGGGLGLFGSWLAVSRQLRAIEPK
jgi:cell division transport system permease protein